MRFLTVFLATMLAATQASADAGIGVSSGMAAGFLHPLGGLDHILAMAAVGLFAARLGGRATWLVPVTFLAMMAIGALLGLLGITVPIVEAGIALSILAIGGLVALGRNLPVAIAAALVGVFAVFHGHAHGAEMPSTVSALSYGGGFLTATLLLLGCGMLAGDLMDRVVAARRDLLARASGGALAVAGLLALAGRF